MKYNWAGPFYSSLALQPPRELLLLLAEPYRPRELVNRSTPSHTCSTCLLFHTMASSIKSCGVSSVTTVSTRTPSLLKCRTSRSPSSSHRSLVP